MFLFLCSNLLRYLNFPGWQQRWGRKPFQKCRAFNVKWLLLLNFWLKWLAWCHWSSGLRHMHVYLVHLTTPTSRGTRPHYRTIDAWRQKAKIRVKTHQFDFVIKLNKIDLGDCRRFYFEGKCNKYDAKLFKLRAEEFKTISILHTCN